MIPSTLDTVVNYTGNGAASTYAFPFRTFDSDDVKAKVRLIADGMETDLVYNVDFSLIGVGNKGGDLNLINSGQAWLNGGGDLLATYKIFIYFEPNLKQLTRYQDLGRQSPKNFEVGLDRVTMFVKGFFQGIGEVTRSIKLPKNIHADEFDPTLPSDFNATAGLVPAINDTLDGWKMFDASTLEEIKQFLDFGYTPTAIQTLGSGNAITIAKYRRQHVRIQSSGGDIALDTTPFGNDPAKFRDGMEVVVEGVSADTLTFAENDNDYGFQGNGGIELKDNYVVSFVYNETKKRFFVKSLGAW